MRFIPTLIVSSAVIAAGLQFMPIGVTDVVSYSASEQVFEVSRSESVPVPIPQATTATDDRPVVQHVALPESVKAIYMSACVAGTPSFRNDLITLIEETELNAVVIDIKDASGSISFPPVGATWQAAWQAAECGARDMKDLIALLHDKNIFVIGRLQVFQDPLTVTTQPQWAVKRADGQTTWKDYKGISFVDVASQPYWDRIIELVVESYNIGFDEINFDYIRYPSDGNMEDISFPVSAAGPHGLDKPANLEAFFAYLHEAISDPALFAAMQHTSTGRLETIPYTSADLFGMTTTNYGDLSIGQVQDRAAPYFDFIAPMVYPSHYPNSFLNLGNPNNYPYEVVYYAMKTGVDRMRASTTPLEGFKHTPIMIEQASSSPIFSGEYVKPAYGPEKFRTWIQDFDYGGDYDAADVRAQIQASYDAGVSSWMIWAPSNRYTRAALQASEQRSEPASLPVSESAF